MNVNVNKETDNLVNLNLTKLEGEGVSSNSFISSKKSESQFSQNKNQSQKDLKVTTLPSKNGSHLDLIDYKSDSHPESSLTLMKLKSKQESNLALDKMRESSAYLKQVKKLTMSLRKEGSDFSPEKISMENNTLANKSIEIPFLSLHKAIRQKKELEKEQNNSLMNELATKLNLFKQTVISKHSISSDSEDDAEDGKRKKKKMIKQQSSILEKQLSIELKQKQELLDRVFWTKEKMEQIRNQLKTAKEKINEKTKNDFDELYELIDSHNKDAIMYVFILTVIVINYWIRNLNRSILRS
jgi:hypothetical protein